MTLTHCKLVTSFMDDPHSSRLNWRSRSRRQAVSWRKLAYWLSLQQSVNNDAYALHKLLVESCDILTAAAHDDYLLTQSKQGIALWVEMGFRQTFFYWNDMQWLNSNSVVILSYFEVLLNIAANYIKIDNSGTFQFDGRDAQIDLNVVVTQRKGW